MEFGKNAMGCLAVDYPGGRSMQRFDGRTLLSTIKQQKFAG